MIRYGERGKLWLYRLRRDSWQAKRQSRAANPKNTYSWDCKSQRQCTNLVHLM